MIIDHADSGHREAIRSAAMVINPVAFTEPMRDLWFAGDAEETAVKVVSAYFSARGWPLPGEISVEPKPIAHLVWMQSFNGIDDVHDYYEVARPGDKSIDGSDPFPVWDKPVHFPSADGSAVQFSQDSKETTDD